MSKSNTGRNSTVLAVAAALAVTGGVWYFRQNKTAPETPVPVSSPLPESAEAANTPAEILPSVPTQQTGEAGTKVDRQKLFIYRVTTNENGSSLEKKTFPASESGDISNEQAAVRALDAMAEGGEAAPLPKGTKATSVTFGGDLATVDFNEAFQKNFTGGDENEALTLNAVLATLGQFPGVKQVQILVAGQKIDSLGGNQSLTEPLPIPNNLSVAKSEP